MKGFFKTLKSVVKSYSIEEKVVSIISLLVFVIASAQLIYTQVKGSGVFEDKASFVVGMVTEKPVLANPLYADLSEANREISSLVFSGLMKYNPETKNFDEDLAKMEVSKDKKEYKFTLKDGVMWQDNQPITADDIIFTFSLIQQDNFQNPILKANFSGVEISKVDDKTVIFKLKAPNSFFVSNLNVGLLPKHILENVEEVVSSEAVTEQPDGVLNPAAEAEESKKEELTPTQNIVLNLPAQKFNLNPIGSGPYKYANKADYFDDSRQRIVLQVNPLYYGEKPKIREIKYLFYPDFSFLIKEKNSLDIIPKVPYDQENLLNDSRFTHYFYKLPQYTAIFINEESQFLKDRRVRVALLKSIDKTKVLNLIQNKDQVDTPLMELNQADWIFKPNLNEAQGSLFDAGFSFDKDKDGKVIEGQEYRKNKDGKVLELTLLTKMQGEGTIAYNENKALIDLLLADWKAIGVKVNVEEVDDETFLGRLRERDYDMILTGQNMGYNLDTFTFWHSSQLNDSGLNLSNYKSFAADQLIEQLRQLTDAESRQNKLNDLAKVIADDVPAIFLYRPKYILLSDNKIKGMFLDNLAFISDRYFNVDKYCIICN